MPSFEEYRGKKGILKKQGWSFICLRRAGHLVHNCDSNIQCLGCQGRHHLAVCDGRGARASDNSAVDGASNQPESATSAMHLSSGMHVFLQTAQAVLSKPGLEGTKKLTFGLFLIHKGHMFPKEWWMH